MEDIIKLEQKIVPEMIKLLEKRYNILRTIFYKQPIGRRILANDLDIGERIVRTEVNFLKGQNLIQIDSSGMTVTKEGEKIIESLKEFIHSLKGLADLENTIKNLLGIQKVVIVPGNLDDDKTIKKELGRAAANYMKDVIKEGSIISLTGGSTIKELVDNMPKISNIKNLTVVPGRGGIGRNVEMQANTLVANLSQKINANYKLMHVPDSLSEMAIKAVMEEKQIREVLELVYKSNILVYGVGKANVMAERRGISGEDLKYIEENQAVGEAFGYYFNTKGKIVYSSPIIGIRQQDIDNIKILIAVAGGKSKAQAILSTQVNRPNSVLITDEGAAREIINLLNNL